MPNQGIDGGGHVREGWLCGVNLWLEDVALLVSPGGSSAGSVDFELGATVMGYWLFTKQYWGRCYLWHS